MSMLLRRRIQKISFTKKTDFKKQKIIILFQCTFKKLSIFFSFKVGANLDWHRLQN